MLLAGFLIQARNQPAVSSLQPATPALQAKEMAFTWLYLRGNATEGSEEPWGALGGPGWRKTPGEQVRAEASGCSYRSVCLSGLLVQLAVTFLK